MRIQWLQHVPFEGLGSISRWADENGCLVAGSRLFAGDALPSISTFDLLVVMGEMGRTPKPNKGAGRDHWGRLSPLAFFGGGLPMGQVIGQSARGADVPATSPISTQQLMTTVMHTLFDDFQVIIGKWLVTGEVIIKAVLDRRTDGYLCTGE